MPISFFCKNIVLTATPQVFTANQGIITNGVLFINCQKPLAGGTPSTSDVYICDNYGTVIGGDGAHHLIFSATYANTDEAVPVAESPLNTSSTIYLPKMLMSDLRLAAVNNRLAATATLICNIENIEKLGMEDGCYGE